MRPRVTLALVVWLSAVPAPESVSFDQAVARALSKHPSLKVAEEDIARAAAQVEQQRSPSLPTLAANGAYTRLDADRIVGDRVAAGRDQLGANLTLSVPIIAPARWAQWWRSTKSLDAQRATSADVRRQVALQVARTWLSVLGQKRVLDAAVRARDTAKAHLDYAVQRRAGGIGNRLDEMRAAQELAVSQTQLENAAGNLVKLQEQLGVAAAADAPLDAALEEPQLQAPGSLNEALDTTKDRLDVKASVARRDAAESQTHADFTDYLPLVTLVGTPFYQNPPTLTQPLTGWQAQAVLTLPLYDGGLRYGQQHERRANARSADAQTEAVLRQANSEVRSAFEVVRRSDAALESARDAAKAANEALELSNVAYRAGATTNLELTDAERRARDADTAAAVAEDSSRQARLDLLAAAGRFPTP